MKFEERYLETLNTITSDLHGIKLLEQLKKEAARLAEDIFWACDVHFSKYEKPPEDFATIFASQFEVELALAITQKYHPAVVRKEVIL